MIEVSVKTSINLSLDEVIKKALKENRINPKDLISAKVIKRSLDARREFLFLYVLGLELRHEDYSKFTKYEEVTLAIPKIKNKKTAIVVGFGPSGMFSSLVLAKAGFKVIVFERGSKVEERVKDIDNFFNHQVLDPNSNIQFGEGGAGTFSDGKLNTRTKSPLSSFVMDSFIKYGANEEISYVHNPHIGTDELRKVVKNFREDLIKLGVEFHFNSLVDDLVVEDNYLKAVKVGKTEYQADYFIFGLGHSSRDTFKLLYDKGVKMEAKSFAMGFRVEHLQDMINRSQYKLNHYEERLGAAEYRLVNHNHGCYTFCMCPGGEVVNATSILKHNVTNGMSEFKRDSKYANSAILVNVNKEDFSGDVFKMLDFQEEIEKKTYLLSGDYKLPAQNIKDFILGKVSRELVFTPSPKIGVCSRDLTHLYPAFITDTIKESLETFSRRIDGFKDGVIIGSETRSSSPIRIFRDSENLNSNLVNLYPTGEGAGYAGGITSASMDGCKVALKLINKEVNDERS